MSEAKHTPLPWTISQKHPSCIHGNREIVLPKGIAKPQLATVFAHETMGEGEQQANAEIIVVAVNSHAKLTADRAALLAACNAALEFAKTHGMPTELMQQLHQAIRQAESP